MRLTLLLLSSTTWAMYPTTKPVAVAGLNDATQLAAGGSTMCALRKNGSVVCWGGYAGHFGRGGFEAQPRPAEVPGLADVRQIAGGTHEMCAAHGSGKVSCWNNETAKPVGGVTNGAEVAVGSSHVCLRQRSGTVVCWGSNSDGQLGDGKKLERSEKPVAVPGLRDVVALAAKYDRTCAQRKSGELFCWGKTAYTTPGCNESPIRATPVQVPVWGTPTVGAELTCAISEKSLRCERPCGHEPRFLHDMPASSMSMDAHTGCVVSPKGDVRCFNTGFTWGDWAYGKDDGPVEIPALSGITHTAVTSFNGCALKSSGAVLCWGRVWEALGNGSSSE